MLEATYDGNGNLATETLRESIATYLLDARDRMRATESGSEIINLVSEFNEEFCRLVNDLLNEVNKLQDENAQLAQDLGGRH